MARSPAIHAAFGATPSCISQGTEAWALRNICGCFIDSTAEFALLHTGVWTFPHSPYPSELVQFQYWQCCIEPCYSGCGPRISSFGLLGQEHLQPGACWIRIWILTRALDKLYAHWCVKSTFTMVLFRYEGAERVSTCGCWTPRSFSGLLIENLRRWDCGICIFKMCNFKN